MTEEQIIKATKELVAIKTTADNLTGLRQAVEHIAGLLAVRQDITIERFTSNNKVTLLAYYGSVRPTKFDVLFCGHIDVVPGQNHQYQALVQKGRLYGRGTYDMKMATIIMADVFLRTAGKSDTTIGLLIVPDEETGGNDGTLYALTQGVDADFVIIGEMTDLGICNQTRGICWADVAFFGVKAHTGYPWEGQNAITAASEFVRALHNKYPTPTTKQWRTTAVVSAIRTPNTTYNLVPDEATVHIDFRFTPDDPDFATQETLQKAIESLGFGARVIDFPMQGKPVDVPTANPYLRHLLQSVSAATGQPAKTIRRYASSDARHFAAYGIPAVEFGLSGGSLHGDQEYVQLASVTPYQKALTNFAIQPMARRAHQLVALKRSKA